MSSMFDIPSYQDDVEVFMEIGGQEYPSPQCMGVPYLSDIPDENDDQIKLYMDLIEEEHTELRDAYKVGDTVEVADALADMVWVIMGLASTMDIDFQEIWEEVKRSNMSKFVDGVAMKNPDTGKIMKPPTFSEPDLAPILFGRW